MRVALKEFSGDGPEIRMRARVHGNGPGRDGKLCETVIAGGAVGMAPCPTGDR